MQKEEVTLSLWCRVGAQITVKVPKDYTEEDVLKAAQQNLEKNNPDKKSCFFTGEWYIPQNQRDIAKEDDGPIFSDDLEGSI